MGVNVISWRRIRTLNARLGGERFIHAFTCSHGQHWYWTAYRPDGSRFTVDTRTLTVEPDTDGMSSTTERLLLDRTLATDRDSEWLQILDERIRQVGWTTDPPPVAQGD